jgi:hypothetical protein
MFAFAHPVISTLAFCPEVAEFSQSRKILSDLALEICRVSEFLMLKSLCANNFRRLIWSLITRIFSALRISSFLFIAVVDLFISRR